MRKIPKDTFSALTHRFITIFTFFQSSIFSCFWACYSTDKVGLLRFPPRYDSQIFTRELDEEIDYMCYLYSVYFLLIHLHFPSTILPFPQSEEIFLKFADTHTWCIILYFCNQSCCAPSLLCPLTPRRSLFLNMPNTHHIRYNWKALWLLSMLCNFSILTSLCHGWRILFLVLRTFHRWYSNKYCGKILIILCTSIASHATSLRRWGWRNFHIFYRYLTWNIIKTSMASKMKIFDVARLL